MQYKLVAKLQTGEIRANSFVIGTWKAEQEQLAGRNDGEKVIVTARTVSGGQLQPEPGSTAVTLMRWMCILLGGAHPVS
jgi:hypothetical protein